MKKIFLVLACCTAVVLGHAQSVGIGTAVPDASAKLDISDNTRGLLVPRMTAAERDLIVSPANGLLVYVSSDSSFYYYHNNWFRLPNAGLVWQLGGNPGTADGIDFLGTTDNVALTFRMNNEPSGRIDSASYNSFLGYQSGITAVGKFNTAMGFQAMYGNINGHHNTAMGTQALYSNVDGIDNAAFGYRSLFANVNGLSNTASGDWSLRDNVSGSYNSAFGKNALIWNTVGAFNTGIGASALAFNTVGGSNTAAGYLSLFLDSSGSGNTASGQQSLQNNRTGNYNTAAGYFAGSTNTNGSNNTLIGANADVSVAGLSNAGAIGYNAKVAASNSFVIGGTGADAVNVGIGTSNPTERLDVIGNIKATGTISPSDIRYKTNVRQLGNSLQKLLAVNGVTYNWRVAEFPGRGFSNEEQIGFIAQDVEKLFPQVVHTGSDGYKGLDYAKLVPVLVEAIKEQQRQIEELRKIIKRND